MRRKVKAAPGRHTVRLVETIAAARSATSAKSANRKMVAAEAAKFQVS
jgi:hypothetical protein